MKADLYPEEKREMGGKLANFRRKLAAAIGEKKITQPAFGEMFGGYNGREVNSYETGKVGMPGLLLFFIWKSGNSLDGVFGEEPISESGRHGARKLYDDSALVQLANMSEAERKKVYGGLSDGKNAAPEHLKKDAASTSRRRKTRSRQTRTTKER